MKKPDALHNIRPEKKICEGCRSHGICAAEDGHPQYQCARMLHPTLFDKEGNLIE